MPTEEQSTIKLPKEGVGGPKEGWTSIRKAVTAIPIYIKIGFIMGLLYGIFKIITKIY